MYRIVNAFLFAIVLLALPIIPSLFAAGEVHLRTIHEDELRSSVVGREGTIRLASAAVVSSSVSNLEIDLDTDYQNVASEVLYPLDWESESAGGGAVVRSRLMADATVDGTGIVTSLSIQTEGHGSYPQAGDAESTGAFAAIVVPFEVRHGTVEMWVVADLRASGRGSSHLELYRDLDGIPGGGDSPRFDDSAVANSRPTFVTNRRLILDEGLYRLVHFSMASPIRLDEAGSATGAVAVQFGPDPNPPEEHPEHTWKAPASGSFGTAANWEPAGVPGNSSAAIISVPGSYSVNVGDRTIGRLLIGGEPSLNVTFTNTDLTVQSTVPDPAGIVINHGNFTLDGGTLRGVHGLVGSSAATQVAIADGLWTNQATLTVGGGGEATMFIEEDGAARAPIIRIGNATNGAFGTVSLDGGTLEAAQLDVGRSGSGTLAIDNGGSVSVSPVLFSQIDPQDPLYQLLVGVGASGSNGRIVVRGVDPDSSEPSTLSVIDATAVIGAGGASAQLVIEDGGFVEMTPGVVFGQGAGSVATLTVRGTHDASGARSTLVVNDLGSNQLLEGSLSLASYGGRAEMHIDGGLVRSTNGEVGSGSGVPGTGIVELTNGGRWDVDETLFVGGSDEATKLTITDGILRVGDVSAPLFTHDPFGLVLAIGAGTDTRTGNTGILHVSGFLSAVRTSRQQVLVGHNGTGTLLIDQGGRFFGPNQLFVGDRLADGPDASAVADNATIRVTGFAPGAAPGDPVARSSLEMDSNDIAGIEIYDGAEMFVEQGAVVQTHHLTVGGSPVSRGRLVIDGLGNDLPSTLIATGEISIGDPAYGARGLMTVSNGAVVSAQTLSVYAGGILFFDTGGGVVVGEGDIAEPNVLRLNAGGELRGDGTLYGSLDENGGVNNLAGAVSPGRSPGTLTIEGHYWQGIDGVLEIELGGVESGFDHDVLAVSGTATFEPGTTIRIILIDPNPDDDIDEVFIPRTGDDFSFVVADDVVLSGGTTLDDLVEFADLPAGVEIDLRLDVVNGATVVTAATIAAPAPPPGPRITSHPKDVTATAGSPLELTVGIDGASNAAYQWRRNGAAIAGATESTFELASTQAFHAGDYSVVVTADGTSVESRIATLAVETPPSSNARLLNLSTRALSLAGDDLLIPGFVISGSGTKRMLIRGVGPGLSDVFGIPGTLEDPRMTLMQGGGVVASNDDWGDSAAVAQIVSASAMVGAFPLLEASRDAVLLVDLPAGAYTVPTIGADGGAGIALVELYDADVGTPTATLVNISNRGFVDVGDRIMIPGFVVSEEGSRTFLIRAVGPGLASGFGLDGVLEDPILTVFAGADVLFSIDDWSDAPGAQATAATAAMVGAFPLPVGSGDAAFVVTLPPGAYTAQASGKGGATGIALVEVYLVP